MLALLFIVGSIGSRAHEEVPSFLPSCCDRGGHADSAFAGPLREPCKVGGPVLVVGGRRLAGRAPGGADLRVSSGRSSGAWGRGVGWRLASPKRDPIIPASGFVDSHQAAAALHDQAGRVIDRGKAQNGSQRLKPTHSEEHAEPLPQVNHRDGVGWSR